MIIKELRANLMYFASMTNPWILTPLYTEKEAFRLPFCGESGILR